MAIIVHSGIWKFLVGNYIDISIEHKIFNAISIFSFLGILVCVLFNIAIGLRELALLLSVFLPIQLLIFYFSRFKNWLSFAKGFYVIAGYSFLIINYLQNSGIAGPTLLAFLVLFHFLVSITSESINWMWIPIHILVVVVLSLIEFSYPHLVHHSYTGNVGFYIDINFTFCVLIVITYFINRSTRRKYYEERNKVAVQKAEIEEKNLKLEHIDKERNRLFSVISHDLRSPLNTIVGYMEIFHDLEDSPETREEVKTQLVSLTKHTQDMLDNLLHGLRHN